MPNESQSAVYRFENFEADVRAGELRKHGMRLKLSGQPFQVLVVLLRRAGDVVTREELQQALWPADTYVDFDHGLNTAINKVRSALGDSGSSPRFVETLARRGYRFIGTVQVSEVASRAAEASTAEPPAAAAAPDALPRPPRALVRSLFSLAQIMYLILYVEALRHFGGVEREAGRFSAGHGLSVAITVLVLAAAGIPVRFFLLFAVGFDYVGLGAKFRRLFPAILVLDVLWALTPFLLADHIGIGLAFAATAALIYLPFGERTLVQMAYR